MPKRIPVDMVRVVRWLENGRTLHEIGEYFEIAAGTLRKRIIAELPKAEARRLATLNFSNAQLQRRGPAPCGTRSGYYRHVHRGEPPCQPCLDEFSMFRLAYARRNGRKTNQQEIERRRQEGIGVFDPDARRRAAEGRAMAKKNRRTRSEIMNKRMQQVLEWAKGNQDKAKADSFVQDMRRARVEVPGATQEIPKVTNKVRPCGGIDHCVTVTGSKAKNIHVACAKARDRGEWS